MKARQRTLPGIAAAQMESIINVLILQLFSGIFLLLVLPLSLLFKGDEVRLCGSLRPSSSAPQLVKIKEVGIWPTLCVVNALTRQISLILNGFVA